MGSLGAAAFAEQVDEGNVSLRTAVHWHLTSNHFPPHPTWMVPVALAAIGAVQNEDWDFDIDLPLGCQTHTRVLQDGICPGATAHENCIIEPVVQWRDRNDGKVGAGDVIESLHLDCFL